MKLFELFTPRWVVIEGGRFQLKSMDGNDKFVFQELLARNTGPLQFSKEAISFAITQCLIDWEDIDKTFSINNALNLLPSSILQTILIDIYKNTFNSEDDATKNTLMFRFWNEHRDIDIEIEPPYELYLPEYVDGKKQRGKLIISVSEGPLSRWNTPKQQSLYSLYATFRDSTNSFAELQQMNPYLLSVFQNHHFYDQL